MPTLFRTLTLAGALALFACKKEPDRWEAAKQQAEIAQEAKKDAPPVVVTETNSFNKAFPSEAATSAKRTFRTDKPGFADAVYTGADGQELCVVTISDTNSDAAVKAKYASASEKLGSYPLTTLGNTMSSVLVADRFQVKVSSKTLTPEVRKDWLQKVDLAALAALSTH